MATRKLNLVACSKRPDGSLVIGVYNPEAQSVAVAKRPEQFCNDRPLPMTTPKIFTYSGRGA